MPNSRRTLLTGIFGANCSKSPKLIEKISDAELEQVSGGFVVHDTLIGMGGGALAGLVVALITADRDVEHEESGENNNVYWAAAVNFIKTVAMCTAIGLSSDTIYYTGGKLFDYGADRIGLDIEKFHIRMATKNYEN